MAITQLSIYNMAKQVFGLIALSALLSRMKPKPRKKKDHYSGSVKGVKIRRSELICAPTLPQKRSSENCALTAIISLSQER